LIEIPDESRSLTLYANDTAGNWAAPQTVYYEIAFNLGTPPIEPFPTTLAVAVIGASVAVVGLGLLVYFRKRNRENLETREVKEV
jgi:ABC-type cobalamin transport system permease subunit